MTFVLSAHSRNTLWLVADRQLSYGPGIQPRDDGVKLLHLETRDGTGVVAYAGLGETGRGMQPSEWMSNVLRGLGGLTFEQSLALLAEVAEEEFPKHLMRAGGDPHFLLAPAFIKDVGPRVYGVVLSRDNRSRRWRYTTHRYHRTSSLNSPSVRLACAGTGSLHMDKIIRTWGRPFLNLLRAHDHDSVSDHCIADALAELNFDVHEKDKGRTVGSRCVVSWRRRPGSQLAEPGLSHRFYRGPERDTGDPTVIPTVWNGTDVGVAARFLMQNFEPYARSIADPSNHTFDIEDFKRRISELPTRPDDRLR